MKLADLLTTVAKNTDLYIYLDREGEELIFVANEDSEDIEKYIGYEVKSIEIEQGLEIILKEPVMKIYALVRTTHFDTYQDEVEVVEIPIAYFTTRELAEHANSEEYHGFYKIIEIEVKGEIV